MDTDIPVRPTNFNREIYFRVLWNSKLWTQARTQTQTSSLDLGTWFRTANFEPRPLIIFWNANPNKNIRPNLKPSLKKIWILEIEKNQY